MKVLHTFSILAILFFVTSCGEYRKVLKSTDPEYKYQKAVEYFEEGDYDKAYPLFDDLLSLYRGTQKAADVYFYFAETAYHMKDYILSSYHYKNFAKTFPNHPNTDSAYFMAGKSYYKQSPRHSLDQTYTMKAMNELQLFVNLYPDSKMLPEANNLIEDLREKLEKKAFDRAKLYYSTEYYQAAVVAFNNVLDQFPDTDYREEILYFRVISAYKLAENSIESKKLQRFIEARTAYREFFALYPNSEYAPEVDQKFSNIEQTITELKKQTIIE